MDLSFFPRHRRLGRADDAARLFLEEKSPCCPVATPDAPFRKSAGPGHLWFQVDGNQLHPDRLAEIRDVFDRKIDQIIRRDGHEEALDRIAFVGVSQGAIVALDGVASGRWKVGAMIGHSGLLPPIPVSPETSGTPILLMHGEIDRSIPPLASTLAASQLLAAGLKVEIKIEPDVGDTISMTGAQLGLDLLRTHLA